MYTERITWGRALKTPLWCPIKSWVCESKSIWRQECLKVLRFQCATKVGDQSLASYFVPRKFFSLLQTHVTLTCGFPPAFTLAIQSAYALLWNPSSFQVWMWTLAPTTGHINQSPSTAICSIYTEAGWLSSFSHSTLMTLHNSTYHSITITTVMINMNMQIWGWWYRSVTKCFSSKVLGSLPRIIHPNQQQQTIRNYQI